MKRPIAILLALVSLSATSIAGEKLKEFPSSEWLSWLHIKIPERFVLDPTSFQGEAKWWAKLDDPGSELHVEVVGYGYISQLDLLLTVPGVTWENLPDQKEHPEELIATKAEHKTAASYFRAKMVPNGSEESRIHGYERFIHRKPDRVEVYYLDGDAYHRQEGRLYQTLTFVFPKGKAAEHQKAIDSIIASARPAFHPDKGR